MDSSVSDYSVFGVQLQGRNFTLNNISDFRYGYQGSEEDDEISGEGNSYTTFHRILDPRVGRWFSIDPVMHPNQSPYCSMDNRPTSINDPLGSNGDITVKKDEGGKDKMTLSNTVVLYNADPTKVTEARMQEVKAALESQVSSIGTDPSQHFQVGGYSNLRVEGKVNVIFATNEEEALKMATELCDGNVFGVVAKGNSYVETGGENSHMKGTLSLESMNGQGSSNYNFAHEWMHLFGLEDRYVHGNNFDNNSQGSVPIAVSGDDQYHTKNNPNIMVSPIGSNQLSQGQVKYLLGKSNVYGLSGFNPTRATQEFINEYKDGLILDYTGDFYHVWYPKPGVGGYYDGTSRSTKYGKKVYQSLSNENKQRVNNYLGQ